MVRVLNQSANQLWKQQRAKNITTLDFLPWLEREKTKAFYNQTGDVEIPMNKPLNDSIQQTLDRLYTQAGLKKKAGTEYFLGIKKTALIYTGVGLAAVIGVIILYKRTK
jgi:hypothetical protein